MDTQTITFTRREIQALHAFMLTSSKVRTYRVQRGVNGVLLLVEPRNRIVRLSP